MWKRYVPSAASALVGAGLQVNGYQNMQLAWILWVLAGSLLLYAAWPSLKKWLLAENKILPVENISNKFESTSPAIKSDLLIQLNENDPSFYWESAIFKGDLTAQDYIDMARDKSKDRSMSRGWRIKIKNNGTQKTLKNIKVKVEEILPKPDKLYLPIQLRFSTREPKDIVDIAPTDAEFVDVIDWEFGVKGEGFGEFRICGIGGPQGIPVNTYKLKIVAYGEDCYSEPLLVNAGMRKEDNGIQKIWLWS